jgi:4-amino-4-deoxy-L-arabinose transferase-like glycosyltransferase
MPMPQPAPSSLFGSIVIVALALPIFFLTGPQQSWMAHDEGLYVGRAMLMLQSGDWVHPWDVPHHKPPGFYWLQAILIKVLGTSEFISRLPGAMAATASLLLVFRVGQVLGLAVEGFVGALFLATSYLFFFYGRLAVPDTLLVALVLMMVLGLIVRPGADAGKQARHAFWAGLALGVMLLVRGPVAFTLALGMLPYLIATRHARLKARLVGCAIGLVIGSLPVCLWLGATVPSQGFGVIQQMMSFATAIATETRHGNGPFYYLWNIGVNAFPWSFAAIFGGWRMVQAHDRGQTALLVGFPVVYLLVLSLASTHLAHYALPLYPFVAMLAAVAVVHHAGRRRPHLVQVTVLGGVGIVLALALMLYHAEVAKGVGVPGMIFAGCLAAGFVLAGAWAFRRGPGSVYASPAVLTAVLLSLAFSAAGQLNIVGNVNPAFKAAAQSEAAQTALTDPVDFVALTGKDAVLALVYSPHWGAQVSDAASYDGSGPAWIDRGAFVASDLSAKVIAEVGQTLLIAPIPKP